MKRCPRSVILRNEGKVLWSLQRVSGQKKRIALSLLFITSSKVWLLDEPFSALDSKAIKIFENKIEDHCKQGGICILTTHQECNINNLREISL